LWALLAVLLSCGNALAGNLNVVGFVRNGQTGEPIAFANVSIRGTTLGTRTDMQGRFKLANRQNRDTITVTAVGFRPYELLLAAAGKAPLEVLMAEERYTLGEVVIRPGENPAHPIVRNAIRLRQRNNPERIQRYGCTTYTKLAVFLDTPPKGDSARAKGATAKPQLPIFFSEKVANNTVDRTTGLQQAEVVAKQQSGLGILDDLQVDGYATAMSTEVSFYQNKIDLFGKLFPNPIGDNAFAYYKYRLKDSTEVDDRMVYTIEFTPKHKKDLAFRGTMQVEGQGWSLSRIETELPREANINFLNAFEVKYDYQRVADTLTFFRQNSLRAKLYYRKAEAGSRATTLTVSKTTAYSNIRLGAAADTTPRRPASSLAQLRPATLSREEQRMSSAIDSLNQLWWMRAADKLSTAAITGYVPVGKIDMGPYPEYVRHNKEEGLRLTLAARTGEAFHPRYSVAAKVGYGFKDEGWKYGGGFTYKPPLERRTLLGVEADRDMATIGSNGNLRFIRENANAPEDDNLITALTARRPNDRLSMRYSYAAFAEHELRRGIVARLRVEHQRVQSGLYIPFAQQGTPVPEIAGTSVSLEGRFSFDEKTIDKFIRRYYLGSRYPIVNTALTAGEYSVLGSRRGYLKAHLTLKHHLAVGLGKLEYVLEAGALLGSVPFPLLEVLRGNETYGLTRYRFNTLNNLQLASDRFASLFAEYHLNGRFVNRIPLVRALNLREVLSAKVLVGALSDRHRRVMDFPTVLGGVREPLVEVGGGFENILRFFRIEGVYRLSPQQLPQAPRFCVKARFQVEF
jgi:hypothetical protein